MVIKLNTSDIINAIKQMSNEAKKWCSKLGEIRGLVERNGVNVIDQNTRAKRNKKRIS